MSLFCKCDFDLKPGCLVHYGLGDYTELSTKRRKRCNSCGGLINIGGICTKLNVYKIPESEIECRIWGEEGEIPRAPRYYCERCSDIAFSLEDLGFCFDMDANMLDELDDYVTDYGPVKPVDQSGA